MKVILTAIALLAATLPAFAQDTSAMETAIQAYLQKGVFMGAVLVARDNTVVLSKGYGMADLEWAVPNTPATKFRLGSITKQFTAASIMLLEERGKLSTSDPIKKHLPDAPVAWDAITIHHLLTHTAGIPNFTAMPEYATAKFLESPVEKTIAVFRDKPLDFAVGEKMQYSNSGYLVLGLLIEKLTGGSYAAFLQENIFTPLAMTDSGYDSNTAIIPRRASGYRPTPAGPLNAGYLHMSIPHAAGALYSTTEDLWKWEQALLGGKVVSAASLKKMLTPEKSDYAYGLTIRPHTGRPRIAHSGGIDGFNTSMAHYPDSNVTVIVLSNINGNIPDLMVAQLGSLAHDPPSAKPKP